MRLFIAIPLPTYIKRQVFEVEEELRVNSSAGRFVPQGNHHITLHFFGESNELVDIAEAMHDAVRDAKPFLVRLGGYGCFRTSGGRTSFISVGGELEELVRVYTTLEAALTERGFVRGRGKLEPHITLGRGVQHPDELKLHIPNEAFRADSIVLFESRSERGGVVYAPLHTERF
ncbi:MAG TPA: RNA 2',3'-cyclic phosphodiesterase [Clostridia bacterium]|nr:RNA 2',3'-cyclic phosphodiesterase [Clostridia bacterium]